MGEFADSVDPASFTVQDPPDYVFLCGGKLTDLDHSLRAQFFEQKVKPDPALSRRVKLAEVADEWYSTRTLFNDLLELEEFLAGLSACTLLFVESAGAIAELGVFTQMDALRGKLIVVIEQSHSKGPSFIVNGPIAQMARLKFGRILTYPWLLDAFGPDPVKLDTGVLGDTLDALTEELLMMLSKRRKSFAFQASDHGHRMLLIADLVRLCVVCHQSEIQKVLDELGIDVKQKELTKYLYLLDQLNLVAAEKYGRVDYYFSNRGNPDFIYYAPKAPADRLKLADRLRADFPMTTDKRRALDAHKRKMAGGRL